MTEVTTVVKCAICGQSYCTHCVLVCPQCGADHPKEPGAVDY